MQKMSEEFGQFLLTSLEIMAALFIVIMGGIALWALVAYVVDVTQSRQAIRRNYPVIGRFRYFFEHLGEFFRQYFFAMDREELPFNRAQRSWVYRAAKDLNNTVAFGSTRDLQRPGSVLFVNCPFPTLGQDAVPPKTITIGADCKQSYTTASLFNISGMSYGVISRPAVRALSLGAKKAGCWMNTGEGGLSPYHLEGGCDIVFQIGTAKNGVRDLDGHLSDEKLQEIAAIPQVRMFEIKLSQGAKPGKGGMLPGAKVNEEIDRVRVVTGKPVGIKTVIGSAGMLDSLFRTIIERGPDSAPDFITVDGAEGGTGAAPMPLIDAVGLPLRETLPLLVNKLCEYGLRERVRVIASGKLINPADVAWALCMGADFITNARGFMFALDCIQALHCNKNTCPTGITTHNEKLQRGLHPKDKAERIAHYVINMIKEVGMIAHACGVRSPRELTRSHARVVQENGLSVALDELHPYPDRQA